MQSTQAFVACFHREAFVSLTFVDNICFTFIYMARIVTDSFQFFFNTNICVYIPNKSGNGKTYQNRREECKVNNNPLSSAEMLRCSREEGIDGERAYGRQNKHIVLPLFLPTEMCELLNGSHLHYPLRRCSMHLPTPS